MNRRLLALLFLAGVSLPGSASERFEFKQIVACDTEHDPYGRDKLVAEREGGRLVVTAWAGITCGLIPVQPDVVSDWGTLTLKLTFETEGPVATCRCTSKVQFLIDEEVPTGQTIYFIKDGNGAAHTTAP